MRSGPALLPMQLGVAEQHGAPAPLDPIQAAPPVVRLVAGLLQGAGGGGGGEWGGRGGEAPLLGRHALQARTSFSTTKPQPS